MNPTEHLSYRERIDRIGQLLSKGITLLLLDEAEEKRRGLGPEASAGSSGGVNGKPKNSVPMPECTDELDRSIYEYLVTVHSASPREIMQAFEISKATAFRRLARLTAANMVTRSGQTAAIRYRVAPFVPQSKPDESTVEELVVEGELKQV